MLELDELNQLTEALAPTIERTAEKTAAKMGDKVCAKIERKIAQHAATCDGARLARAYRRLIWVVVAALVTVVLKMVFF